MQRKDIPIGVEVARKVGGAAQKAIVLADEVWKKSFIDGIRFEPDASGRPISAGRLGTGLPAAVEVSGSDGQFWAPRLVKPREIVMPWADFVDAERIRMERARADAEERRKRQDALKARIDSVTDHTEATIGRRPEIHTAVKLLDGAGYRVTIDLDDLEALVTAAAPLAVALEATQ